jgi:hypothetical protein
VAVDLLREEEALRGCLAALRRRLAEVGVEDLAALLSREPRDPVLALVDGDEIGRALERVHRLVDGLATMLGHVQGVRDQKRRLAQASMHRMAER